MIGVLGLQGDYAAHCRMLEQAGATATVVKKPELLADLDGLVIPGGESTTLIKLMDSSNFWESLQNFADAAKPILGTCAGMILLARQVDNPPQKSLGLIDIAIERNSYGRQVDSFEGPGTFHANDTDKDLYMIFIRAPRIVELGDGVERLATCRDDCVMARQNNVVVASFHPELTDDLTVHRYFLELIG